MFMIQYNTKIIKINTPIYQQTILEILENNNIHPNYQCRNGICGTCRCFLIKGKIYYKKIPLSFLKKNEILICIAYISHSIIKLLKD